MVRKMDTDGSGVISGAKFAAHFNRTLPEDAAEFDVIMSQFLDVALLCRGRKQTCGKLQEKAATSKHDQAAGII